MILQGGYIRDILGKAPGADVDRARLGEDAARQQGRALRAAQRRQLRSSICRSSSSTARSPRRRCATSRRAPACAVEGELVASPAAGQAVELEGARDRGVRRRRSGDATPCRKRGTRWSSCARSRTFARARTPSAPSSACATRSSFAIHQFFQERGFLYVHTPIITASDCRGRRRDVRRHHARSRRTSRATQDGAVDYAQRLLRQARLPHGQRATRRRDLRARRSATSTRSAPPSAPRTRTRRATSPSSG